MDPAGGAAAGLGFSMFFLVIMAVAVGGMVFWIVALIGVSILSVAFPGILVYLTLWIVMPKPGSAVQRPL